MLGSTVTWSPIFRSAGAYLRDDAGVLVSEHDRRMYLCAAGFSVVDVHVRAADAAGVVFDDDRARLCLRSRLFAHFKGFVSEKISGFHLNHPLQNVR